ncbi:hypothetical protein MMC14_010436 [Varicellaria rhodocarpa]|nr:hypothetical protein [Varicellaria rhodocarpa]
MAWVSAIGCPQVMLDIADRRRSMSEQTFESLRLDSDVSKAYFLHGKIEGSIMSGHFQKCLLEVFIYLRFKTLHGQHQSTIKDNRKVRQRKGHRRLQSTLPTSKIYKAAHHALNDLVAECLNMTTEHVERGAYQAERRKISMLKEQGRALLSFSELLKEKDEHVDIWRLFPMKKIRTPLDADITVDVNRYLTLKGDQLTIFVAAIEKLRPKLVSLCVQAQRHSWYFLDSSSPRLRLENADPNMIAEERLDSELLLSCFDTEIPLQQYDTLQVERHINASGLN